MSRAFVGRSRFVRPWTAGGTRISRILGEWREESFGCEQFIKSFSRAIFYSLLIRVIRVTLTLNHPAQRRSELASAFSIEHGTRRRAGRSSHRRGRNRIAQ